MMKLFGLIGYPLSHSFSKQYFTEKFTRENIPDCAYQLFPLEDINMLPNLIKQNETLTGLNVTIPYKEKVLVYLNELDNTAAAIKAVNCIKVARIRDQIHLKGYNTDCYGFELSLQPYLQSYHKKALILGTGGASKAVEYVLKKWGIECKYVSRNARENIWSYDQLTKTIIDEHTLIVNGSPVGMSPDINKAPAIPYHFLNSRHLLYDLIYNPENTLFMQKGKEKGATVMNGKTMLQGQAEKAWEIWNC